jgi:D-beta-D-heptose 7-phosphate kinase/D-beta-D-heptose 1-phosphate adenosyltransferase
MQSDIQKDVTLVSMAPILSIEEFNNLRKEKAGTPEDLGEIVATSGGFDPVHPGHLSCILESHQYGDTVVVIVNGDTFLKNKKGKGFMDLKTRCQIMAFAKGVDYVIPFEIENDQTVCVALDLLKPHTFTKGGDRTNAKNIAEWGVCEKNGIQIITGVGYDKMWSSSDFLKEWGDFYKSHK